MGYLCSAPVTAQKTVGPPLHRWTPVVAVAHRSFQHVSHVHVFVPLAGTKPIVLNAPPLVAYHHVNAFQTTSPNGTTHLTLDVLAMQQADYSNRLSTLSPDTFKAAAKPELVRLVADLTDANKDSTSDGVGLSGRVQARVLSQRAAELAAVHPEAIGLPHSYVYCAASAFDDAQHWGPNQVRVEQNRLC